ncbi:MAG: glycosyltransferase family 4 protein [Meiothermus sp.]|nr:glycosyltransferase family 4 protein [Meiothermus sp.]
MKLLFVTTSLPFGPGEAFVLPELEEIERLGHTVVVVPMYPRGAVVHAKARAREAAALNQGILSLEILRGALKMFLTRPKGTLEALGLVLTRKPLHLLKNLIFFPKALWLAQQVRALGVDHVHAHWVSTTSSMAMVASHLTGVPWSFTAHRWDVVENNLVARKAARAALARFISQSGLEMARQNGLVASSKTRVLHIGVRVEEGYTPVPAPARSSFRVLCPANLLPVKGHTYLIEAMSLLKDLPVELWLAGDGDLRKPLEEQVARLQLDQRVRFLGVLPHDRILKFYADREIDLVALPSVDLGGGVHEGIPVSLMEAMAYEVPVVSTSTGGIPELLGGGAGSLVPPQNPQALAEAIRQLYQSEALRRDTARAGHQVVARNFNLSRVAHALSDHFEAARGRAQEPVGHSRGLSAKS